MGVREVRLELQGLLVLGDRFVQFALLQKSVAEVVVGDREVRLDLQGLLVLGDRFVHSALLQKSVAEVVVRPARMSGLISRAF